MATDVLVVGAGPTGLTLANLLGSMGVNTVLLERNATTVDEPRAVSIDDESMRTLQAIGLADQVQAITARGYGSRYLSPAGKQFAMVDPVVRDYGFDKRNAFQQPELEAVLRRGLRRFANVKGFFSHELLSFEQSNEAVRALVRRPDQSEVAIAARFLIACDGGRSGVRKALGIKLSGSTFAERWLIVDLKETQNRFRHTEVFCNPRRSCITLPGPGGIRRYEFTLQEHEGETTATNEDFVRRLLSEVGPDRDAPIRRMRVYTFHARVAESWRDRNVLLAGDAAHLTPPFAGQGMNSGLRDAHNLAWKLAEVIAGASDTLLDSYEVERKPHAWSMIELALRMGRVMTPRSVLQGALIRAGFRVLGLYPLARDYIAQMKYKPKPRFEHGLLWPDGRGGKETMVGRLLPQPEVEDKERERTLLDKHLPDKPVVLVFSEFPDRALDQVAQAALESSGAAVVGLTPEWMNPISGRFPVYRDATRLFSELQLRTYLEHAFLLRRDRYVAATVPVARAFELAGYVTGLTTSGRASTARYAPHEAAQ
jgi:3-(3-hydroxy-phenyl)propionate hydroxylase